MSSVFFTADTHFFHDNIVTLSNRPFKDGEEMLEAIVARWNERVKRGDVVYHLGDFALTWSKDTARVEALLDRLHGSVHLITGNHDREAVKRAKGFQWIGDYKRIKVDGQAIVLFHYPLISWHGSARGAWHLHGHCHGNLKTTFGKMMDVGVDCWNFYPVELDKVALVMQGKELAVVDHHGLD